MNKIKSVKFWNDKNSSYDDYTRKAVYPIKIADLLDEQLDEAELTLKNVAVEYFQPLTIVEIVIRCEPNAPINKAYFDEINNRTQTAVWAGWPEHYNPPNPTQYSGFYQELIRKFIVASDTSIEVQGLKVKRGDNIGKPVYNHQIYLIEITKIAEGFIGDALTFTNALGNDYTGE